MTLPPVAVADAVATRPRRQGRRVGVDLDGLGSLLHRDEVKIGGPLHQAGGAHHQEHVGPLLPAEIPTPVSSTGRFAFGKHSRACGSCSWVVSVSGIGNPSL